MTTQEDQLSREKQKLNNKLLAVKAANDATTDPTEELETSLQNANEVCTSIDEMCSSLHVYLLTT